MEEQPTSTKGWAQQVKGKVEEAWGTVTGSEETKHQGAVDVAEGKATKHMARATAAAAESIDHQLKSDVAASEALRESAKAATQLGKVHGDQETVDNAAEAKHIAKELREETDAVRRELSGR